jgi:hypothetical protein
MPTSAAGPIERDVIVATATDETLGVPIDMRRLSSGVFYIIPNGTVSAGVVTIEEAPYSNYGGTWALITASATLATGVLQAAHLNVAANAYGWVRARISTAVSAGTVTVHFVGN